MNEHEATRDRPIRCDRCGVELTPGEGSFYVVHVEAFADPTPPSFSAEDLRRDARAEIERLIAEMAGLSEEDLMNQVYRKLTLYLCFACYSRWIENPAG